MLCDTRYSGGRGHPCPMDTCLVFISIALIAEQKGLTGNHDNHRQLSTRILAVVGDEIKTRGSVVVPCRLVDQPFSAIEELVQNSDGMVDPYLSNDMQKDLYSRSLIYKLHVLHTQLMSTIVS